MLRLLFLALATLVLATTMAPATLFDRAIAHATDGRQRLAHAHGNLWHGSGVLATPANGRVLSPWLGLEWKLDSAALLRGKLDWALAVDGKAALRLSLGATGWRAQEISLTLPATPLLQALPHALLHIGWRGHLALEGEAFGCAWQGSCLGTTRLEWRHAAVDVLPEHRLGDYLGDLQASGTGIAVMLTSPATNALRADGRITLDTIGKPELDLRFRGNPAIIARLESVLHGHTRQTAGGGFQVRWP